MVSTALDGHIDIVPGKRGGKPCIAGRRIAVQDVMQWHLHQGMSFESIAKDFSLTLADVHAAMAYYYDHQAEIDQQIANSEAFAERFFSDPANEAFILKNKNVER